MSAQPQPARPIRAAVIGAGLMGNWHAHALTRAGGQLLAVVDIDVNAAQQLAQKYHAKSFATLQELFSHTPIDALHICTPLTTHFELAQRALDAGAHVLVEKPFTPDAESTTQLLAHAEACRRLAQPVHQFVFQRGIQRARARLERIAPLIHLEMTATTAGANGGTDAARDELIAEILPHALALFERFLPKGLARGQWLTQHPAPGEFRALGQVNTCSLAITLSSSARPTRNEFIVLGAQGSGRADLFHGFAIFENARVSRSRKLWQPFASAGSLFTAASTNLAARGLGNEPAYPGLRELIRAFYQAIRSEATAPFAREEIIAIARARDELLARF